MRQNQPNDSRQVGLSRLNLLHQQVKHILIFKLQKSLIMQLI
jgi:hypothetical protein